MATVRTPPPSHGPGVDQALDHWQDYKQQALHNLAQMKGHIAEADKLRSDQKAAELSRETEQELAAARAWCAKVEKELEVAQQERDESRLAATGWQARHQQSEQALAGAAQEAAAVREEACSSARECAELVLQVGQLEDALQSQREEQRAAAIQQLTQAASAMQTLGAVLADASSSSADGDGGDSGDGGTGRKPWDSPATLLDGSFRAQPPAAPTGMDGAVSMSELVERAIALRDERDRAEATCKGLNRRLGAALGEQRSSAEAIQRLRAANVDASAEMSRREREQSIAAVAAAVGAAREEHAAALREREAHWQREAEQLASESQQDQRALVEENEALRAELAELRVQTTGLRAALAAKTNEIGAQVGLGRKVADAQTAAKAAESAARFAEEEAEELRMELHELRQAAERNASLPGDVQREEKKRKAAEAEMVALRAELDAAVRQNEELGEANREIESKLAAGRAAVSAAVTEADVLRGEWEEERFAVQQTMELAEQRLKEQASALTAVAAVSPAASAAIKRMQGQQRLFEPEDQSITPPSSPARQLAEPPPQPPSVTITATTPTRRTSSAAADAGMRRRSSARPSSRGQDDAGPPGGRSRTPTNGRRLGGLIDRGGGSVRSARTSSQPARQQRRSVSRHAPAEQEPPPPPTARGRRGSSAARVARPSAAGGRGGGGGDSARKVARERGADYAKQVEERDEMLRQITDVAGREFVRRNGLGTAPIARVQEVLHSARLEALSHVRTTAGKQVAHALAFAPVEEIERATLSMLGTPAQPSAGARHETL